MGKRLYFGGCSFLEKPNIFENTVLGDYFGDDKIVINNAKGGSNNDQIFRKAFFSILKNDFDFVLIGWTQVWRIDKVIDVYDIGPDYYNKLKEESNASILNTSTFYTQVVANDALHNRYCHLEPEGTDNLLMYTIILQKLLKEKNIPHLFLSMGDAMKYTLSARPGWIELIDEKNYFGKGPLVDRISFAITNDFYKKHVEMFGKDFHDSTYFNPNSLIRDNANHLSTYGGEVLAKQILEHIIENKIV